MLNIAARNSIQTFKWHPNVNLAVLLHGTSSASGGQTSKQTKARECVQDKNDSFVFSREKLGNFVQERPVLKNQYVEDTVLQSVLKRLLPSEVLLDVSQDLEYFGSRVATDIYQLHLECEENPPVLEQQDAWGRRVDRLITCQAWKKMHDISAQEGLISIAYENKYAQWSRLYQVAKLYLYGPSSGLYGCPLAMTDGAAKTLQTMQDEPIFVKAYENLTSRDAQVFWTSGQWMTEKQGGSDVANGTDTYALKQADGSYQLYGYKWFSSATDADMSITLARTVNADGQTIQGNKGLSLFYLETKDSQGNFNNIQIQRLKNKLGTRQLPTAELLLDGATAYKISEEGRGIPGISAMLTISRLHNVIASVGNMRRVVNLAVDYAHKRKAFGRNIIEHPLHAQTLARLEVETRAATLFMMELARLFGLDENDMATDDQVHLLRLLTPIAKLYTAKQAVAVASEGLECFGGQGYMEDTGLPLLLRDSQVLPIWEGTTNILSLDVLRSVEKSNGHNLESFYKTIHSKIKVAVNMPHLSSWCTRVSQGAIDVVEFADNNRNELEMAARDFSYSLARIYMGALLLEHASHENSTRDDATAAVRWCQQELTPVIMNSKNAEYEDEVCKDYWNVLGCVK